MIFRKIGDPNNPLDSLENRANRMNTYQVHVVARRCAGVRDHACARFLRPWNAATAVRLNRRVSPRSVDRATDCCYTAAIGIVSSRPVPSDFVWDGARPVDHRGICSSIIPAAIAPGSSSSIIIILGDLRSSVSFHHEIRSHSDPLVTWKLERSFLIATPFFGETWMDGFSS